MDRPELIELFESELQFLVEKAHRSGVNYWTILRSVLIEVENLVIQADAEYWIKLR